MKVPKYVNRYTEDELLAAMRMQSIDQGGLIGIADVDFRRFQLFRETFKSALYRARERFSWTPIACTPNADQMRSAWQIWNAAAEELGYTEIVDA